MVYLTALVKVRLPENICFDRVTIMVTTKAIQSGIVGVGVGCYVDELSKNAPKMESNK